MAAEKALGLVIRTADWSETSRIATLWTRELGKVRVLAKGGRRLKSNFEVALDLLTLCSIVLLRKSSGSLDLLTEAQVVRRFPQLRRDMPALYGGYYVAELLGDWTEDYDPHPALFDEAVATLEALGTTGVLTGPRLARFELTLLRELGYEPRLENCAQCGSPDCGVRIADCGLEGKQEQNQSAIRNPKSAIAFSASAGGVLCGACQSRQREQRPLSLPAWQALRALAGTGEEWRQIQDGRLRGELRQLLNYYVS